jgi:hypothetical protein
MNILERDSYHKTTMGNPVVPWIELIMKISMRVIIKKLGECLQTIIRERL